MVKPVLSQSITPIHPLHKLLKPHHSGHSPEHPTPPTKRSRKHPGTSPSHHHHHKTPVMHKSDLEMTRTTTDRQLIDLIIRYGNNKEGLPALLSAAKNQDYDAVRTFLKHGADPNARIDKLLPFEPMRALDFAAINGDVKMIQLLVDHGAEVNPGPREFLPIVDMIDKLEDISFPFDESVNPFSSFDSSSYYWSSTDMSTNGFNVDSTSKAVEEFFTHLPTPLHFAILHGQKEAVVALLKNGANPNQNAMAGLGSPFNLAMFTKNEEIFLLLLEHSSLTNETSYFFPTALIHQAVQKGAPIEILQLMLAKGGDLEALTFNEKRTPIYLAPNEEILQFLISQGADLNVRDANGLTPLQYFTEKSFLGGWGGWISPEDKTNKLCRYLELLLDAGADIHAKTADGRNILQLTWNEEVCDFLISRGAVE